MLDAGKSECGCLLQLPAILGLYQARNHVSCILYTKKKQSLCFTPSIASRKNIILVCIQKYLTSIFSACNFTLFTLATETPTTYLNSSREKEKFGSQRMLILSRAIQVGHKKKNPKQTQAGKQIPTAKP